ncbi:MAG: hypothetical protein Q4E35_07645 [Eubacteriales bacterium]|nr:hypothetical protein [Eubacteriales bacterium]
MPVKKIASVGRWLSPAVTLWKLRLFGGSKPPPYEKSLTYRH